MKEIEAKKKALALAGIEPTDENMTRLEGCGYLTINTANGSDYAYYFDGNDSTEAIVEVKTGRVIKESFESLLGSVSPAREMYTFSDFCEDREILSREATNDLRHLRAMWDIYQEDYLAHCKANKLEFERLP